MKPGRFDLPLIGFPKTLRRFVCKRLCCHQKAAQRRPIGVLPPWQHKFGQHIRPQMLCKTFVAFTLLHSDHHALSMSATLSILISDARKPAHPRHTRRTMPPCIWGLGLPRAAAPPRRGSSSPATSAAARRTGYGQQCRAVAGVTLKKNRNAVTAALMVNGETPREVK